MVNKFWKIHNEKDGETAEMLLYGEISDTTWNGDEVTPKAFAEDLKRLDGKDLTVRVNSPGGDVFAAHAIYNQLKSYAGRVTMRIDGMCASAATIITCAGDEVVMPTNAVFLIHNPSSALMGYYNANDLKRTCNQLDAIRDTIVNVYLNRVDGKLSAAQIKHKMDDETIFSAQEALDCGFVDTIDEAEMVKNSVSGETLIVNSVQCDLGRFRNGDRIAEIMQRKTAKSEGKDMEKNEILEKIKSLLQGGNEAKPAEQAPQVADSAVAAERKRWAELEALDHHDDEAVTKMVDAAKSNGMTAAQVKPFVDAHRAEATQRNENEKVVDAIKALIADQTQSGAENITPAPSVLKVEDEKKASIDEIVKLANGMK